jgi:hypothetical protein
MPLIAMALRRVTVEESRARKQASTRCVSFAARR